MLLGELSGLIAALCWTSTSLMAPGLIKHFGTTRFNVIRISIASVILITVCLIQQRFDPTLWDYALPLALSGFIGIFLGDTMLFNAVHRLGPRRAGVIFATNAPVSILLSWLFLSETLSFLELVACAIVLLGVVVSILFGKRGSAHEWEQTKGRLWVGIFLAFGGAVGQASGALLAKPALLAGADPFAVSAFRVTVGATALLLVFLAYYRPRLSPELSPLKAIPIQYFFKLAGMATIGMVLGMSILVWGIGNANVGIVMTLSATVPVLVLPGLWLTTKIRPAFGAWMGALLVVIGSAIIIFD
ncbi:DMT family transporter [Marinomonas balearica]|uniref:EamA-like transporter family protein n=1 Tax=Marinomonas balearica TaxID=491947 RepID=A0A4R6M3L2_9GAMM|nr:DMT family transporter [Marinomonas balearica]TDO95871.1 EamA-like transporter family protein [Marinomonas balearica]